MLFCRPTTHSLINFHWQKKVFFYFSLLFDLNVWLRVDNSSETVQLKWTFEVHHSSMPLKTERKTRREGNAHLMFTKSINGKLYKQKIMPFNKKLKEKWEKKAIQKMVFSQDLHVSSKFCRFLFLLKNKK